MLAMLKMELSISYLAHIFTGTLPCLEVSQFFFFFFNQPSSKPSPSVTAAKLMAMGIASSLDYDSSSDKEGMLCH